MSLSTDKLQLTKEPIWEQQEEEKNSHYFFGGLFFRCNDTVEEFQTRIQHEWDTNHKEGFLDYKPFTLTYFRQLCTDNQWIIRRKAYQKYRDEKLLWDMDEVDKQSKLKIFKLENQAEIYVWEKFVDDYENGTLTAAGAEHLAKAGKITKDAKNRDMNKPKDITQTNVDANVGANVEASIDKEGKLVFTKEEMERIQNVSNEPDEETQEFLDKL